MTDPQSNGHAPTQANMPQPSTQAAFEAQKARINALRDELAKQRSHYEDQLDYFNAMYMTAEGALQSVAAENSRLKAENDQLSARVTELDTPAEEPSDA